MILTYHKVAPVAKTRWWITVDRFYEHMQALRGRQVVPLDDYDPANEDHAVITFDGVYDNVYHYAVPILKHFGYPFELFVIGDTIGRENDFDQHIEPPCLFADDAMLRAMCLRGGRVQWHTRSHRRFSILSDDEAALELTPPKALSSRFASPNLRWFAYPHGDFNAAHCAAVAQRFAGALACDDGDARDRFNLPRKLVFEETSLLRGTVAAIVANYNYGGYLREAIDSLERQSSRPEEVLVIDDASTDDSEVVLSELESKGYRVVRNEKNLGIVGNFRKAVSLTNSDYIFVLGADNRLRSDYVLQCRTALDRSTSIAVAYSDMTIFGPLSGALSKAVGAKPIAAKRMANETVYLWRFPEPQGEALENFANRNFVHGSSMYRRNFYEKVGGYQQSNGPEDHHLFYRIWKAGGSLSHVARPLLEYRQHSPAQANTALSSALEIKALRAASVAKAGALQAQRDAFEAERIHDRDRLRSVRQKLAELEATNGRIRSSRMWPLLRAVRPLRKRLKHLTQLTEEIRQLAFAGAPPLGTPPNHSRSDLIEALPQIAQSFLKHGMRPGHWVAPEVTKSFQKHGFTIVANTFYAVTPDLNALCDKDWRAGKYDTAWRTVPSRPVEEMLGQIARFAQELTGIPVECPKHEDRFYWNNPMFSPLDAAAYYGVVRSLEPQRILEVGSGYSTAIALMAAERCGRRIEISCIEPYPSRFLRKQRRRLHTLIERKVQDIDPLLFETLESGDILFIDSSHCSHLGSDLNVLMFDCMPRLKPGVYVHFHDIFLPFEYPRTWLEDIGIMWNEQYLLLAFLMSNKNFEVLWSSSNAGMQKREALVEMFAQILPEDAEFLQNMGAYSGGSLWIRKTE